MQNENIIPQNNPIETDKIDLQPELSEKNEELTDEEKKKIAILELGSDYTATITIGNKFLFGIHAPTVEEDLKITIQSGNMLANQIREDKDLKMVTNVISTLDIIVDSIYKLEKDEKTQLTKKKKLGEGTGCFWSWVKNRRDVQTLYEILILPLYLEYLNFRDSLDTDLDELKNFYAQD